MVGLDWAERRCAPSFVPTRPPDLTAVRLQACAADHNIIDMSSSSQAYDPRSDANTDAYYSSAGGAVASVGEASERARLAPAARGGVLMSCREAASHEHVRPLLAVGACMGRGLD